MTSISRQEYSGLFGVTTGDQIRLGNTDLYIEVEEDLRTIGDESITLEAATGDQAQASEAIEAVVDLHGAAEPSLTAAGFNPNYLLDALGALDAPYVDFAFTEGSSKPCLLTGLTELDGEPIADYRHVIMLMRLPTA